MELKNLTTFIQVVESGSFTKAAAILGYTQSTVSFQIRQLENELNCQLFDRINHNISLTDRGKQLLLHATEIQNSMGRFKDDISSEGELNGEVHIVSADSICEKMMLLNYGKFYQTHPGIKLNFSTANTDEMLKALDRNEADVVFPLDNHIYKKEYITVKESPVNIHFVTNPGSPLAGRKKLQLKDLLDYPFLLTEKGMSYRKILDEKLAQLSLEMEPVLETGRTDILSHCVETGQGIAFLPDFVTEEKVRSGKLVYLDVEDFELTIWKQLIYHKQKWISRPLAAFIDFVKEQEFVW